jgi:hypothetical protein
MNREEELNKQFPLEDGTTYIQNLDKSNEPKGVGDGGESIKENFIDSASASVDSVDSGKDKLNKIYEKLDRDFMYNWIKGHKERK